MVQWTAHAIGLDLEFVPVNTVKGDHRTKEFLKLNPNAKFPVLQDGDFVLYESNAMAQYLLAKYGNKSAWAEALLPSDVNTRASVWQWMDWKHGALRSGCSGIVRRKVMKKLLPDYSKHSMALDFVEIPESRQVREMLESLKIVEEQLSATKAFIVKGTTKPTLADIALFEEIDQLRILPAGAPPPEGRELAQNYPNIASWLQRVRAGVPGYDIIHATLNKTIDGVEQQRKAGKL